MMRKNTIMLIPPTELPIPAVEGGAIETLITNLLEVNEIEQKVKFIVISKDDEKAKALHFEHSKIYYFSNGSFEGTGSKRIRFLWKLYSIWLKVFQNHLVVKIFRKSLHRKSYFEFQCYQIAIKENVDYIVNEGRWDEENLLALKNVVGEKNFYNHIHCNRNEDIRARKIINNSISISEYVRRHWAVDQNITGKNVVLYNGIDVGKFACNYTQKEKYTKRSILGVSKEDIVVLFCGRIIPEKGIKELLDAFELLKQKNIKLILIGSFAFSATQTSDYSIEMIRRAEKASNVIPLGYISNDKIAEYYAIADILVVPSICQEGAGLVAIEGMASGLPLVVTKSGGMVEYVNNNTAIEIPIDAQLCENIAENLILLASNVELRKKMGEAGRERAKIFTKERYYQNFCEIFDD